MSGVRGRRTRVAAAALLLAVAGLWVVGQCRQGQQYYLIGNLDKTVATVTTDRGDRQATFFGTIGFRVGTEAKGQLVWHLVRLNLVSEGVSTAKGDSGTIGIALADLVKATYSPRTGQLGAEFQSTLHYELIDRVKGYRQLGVKGEQDLFVPYTEGVAGKIIGTLPEGLQPGGKGNVYFQGEVSMELSSRVLGALRRIHLVFRVRLKWILRPLDVLKIQPVFIGSGPSDPNATGTAFTELMKRTHEMWGRCGTVRCLGFYVNSPIYVNNNAYRVLDSAAEAASLRGEVSVSDAVEVFVVERMSTSLTCSWGGGACFSSGTASAKIVTSDQQLAVPCPCPCPSYCPCGSCICGPVNPYHLAHELGHALDLAHPPGGSGLADSTVGSIMEPSGFCCDNPDLQSAKNCRNAFNPLLYWGAGVCTGTPDIMD